MGRLLLAIAFGWLLGLSASTALAEDVDQGWEFSFAPYLWALSINGEAGAGGTTAEVDVPFSDIFKNLNLGLMGQFTARRGRWLGVVDGLYAILEDHETLDPTPIGFGPAEIREGPLVISIPRVQTSLGPTEVDVDVDMVKLKLAGGYRLLSHPLGAADDPRRMTLDVYAGGRFWYVDMDVEVRIRLSLGFPPSAAIRSKCGKVSAVIGCEFCDLLHACARFAQGRMRGAPGGI